MISEKRVTSTPSGIRRRAALFGLAATLFLFAAPSTPAFARTDPPLSASTDSDEALRLARESSDKKDFTQAAATLKAALKADPDNKELASLYARVLAWSRHYDESIAVYRKLLARHPDDAFDRAGYARTLAWSGRSDLALPEFRRALEQDPKDAEVRIAYARALSWDGDLAGASDEYLRLLAKDPKLGDAWLGLATVARWRDAPTASDAFSGLAASRGADHEGLEEERGAVRLALRPVVGSGWTATRERQITSDSTAFKLETSGEFIGGRTTMSRTFGIAARAASLHHWEKNPGLPTDTTLNYDLKSTEFRGDLSYLRPYPLQIAAGLVYQHFDVRNPSVLFPLGGDHDFFGFNARVWGYSGRFSPSAGARREFIAIKSTDPLTGARVLVPGGVTNADLGLKWDWNGRGSLSGTFSKGFYTDDNQRTGVGGLVTYRLHRAQPRVAIDYGLNWSDFTRASSSYFTPLESVKHAAGITASGYSEHNSLDYGARYEFSIMNSSNFDDIASNMGSVYLNGTVFGSLPLGIEGYYSVDNHSYRTWGLTLSGSVRW